jgi:hypothetical protein
MSVSAHRALTLDLIVQYKCRVSVDCCIAVYSIILDQWLSMCGPLLPRRLGDLLKGKVCDKVCLSVVRCDEKHHKKIFPVYCIIYLS